MTTSPFASPEVSSVTAFLLLLRENASQIVAASENAADFLELPIELILGAPVESIIEREVLSALRLNIATDASGMPSYLGSYRMRDRLYSVTTHLVGGERHRRI